MNLDTLQNRLAPVFAKFGAQIAVAYLFGSHASGKETGALSDLDIAVLLTESDAGICLDLRLRLYAEISKALGRNDVDVVVLNTTRNLVFTDEVLRQGQVLVENDPERRFDFEARILHRALDFRQQRLTVLGA